MQAHLHDLRSEIAADFGLDEEQSTALADAMRAELGDTLTGIEGSDNRGPARAE